ncbi:MAG: SEC-C metal-binding domain-containing protein [Pseudomonadota bacterium]
MNRLWKYEDYVNYLSHENVIVRRWAFSALESRFLNRYTDHVSLLLNDGNDYLVCGVLRYLVYHRAIQHAPAILDRFRGGHGIISSNCASALAKFGYEPAMEPMIDRFFNPDSSETFLGVLEFLSEIRTEESRAALITAVTQLQDSFLLEPAMAGLWRHHHPDDIHVVMEKWLDSYGDDKSNAWLIKTILPPLGGESYFSDLTEGRNDIVETPSKAIEDLCTGNSHVPMDEKTREAWITALDKRQYRDVAEAIRFDVRDIINERYRHDVQTDRLRELSGQDIMCLRLLDALLKRESIWSRAKQSKAICTDLISLAISVYFAVKERGAYVKALSAEAGLDELLQALQNSGPRLPRQLQDRISALAPVIGLKNTLSDELMTWGDIWAVRLMGRIGSKEFVPDLIRVLHHSDSLDYIHDDAINSIISLDETADECLIAAIKNGELDDWDSFGILEHLPYAEAYDLALSKWGSQSENTMGSYEVFASCIKGIGDRRGIEKLQDIYHGENDAVFMGDALECLCNIHLVDIPELPEIRRKRKERDENLKGPEKSLSKLMGKQKVKKEINETENPGNLVPFKKSSGKVGRNAPCPCGSGKKYKKCCLNKP